MRGVPLLMTPRMTSSRPPADSWDSVGPYCTLVICGLAWQTTQDWLKSRIPKRGAALHGRRAPGTIFLEAYAAAAPAERWVASIRRKFRGPAFQLVGANRSRRKREMSWLVSPRVARSARISPITGANLNP